MVVVINDIRICSPFYLDNNKSVVHFITIHPAFFSAIPFFFAFLYLISVCSLFLNHFLIRHCPRRPSKRANHCHHQRARTVPYHCCIFCTWNNKSSKNNTCTCCSVPCSYTGIDRRGGSTCSTCTNRKGFQRHECEADKEPR